MSTGVMVGDLHCGAPSAVTSNPQNVVQEQLLKCWEDAAARFYRPDFMVINGDANDGEDPKGRDLTEDDIPEQVQSAMDLITMFKPAKVFVLAGTAYHTGDTVQHEKFLAKMLACSGIPTTFHHKLNLEVEGWFRLECRHKTGGSTIPHGRFTATTKSRMWNVLNAAIRSQQAGDPAKWPHLSVRSHVHYWQYAEDAFGAHMVLPCWQALGGRYGDEQCDGHINIGLVALDIGKTESEGWKWEKRLYPARVVDRTVRL